MATLANYKVFPLHQWRRLLGRAAGVIPAVPPRPLPFEVVDGPEEARAPPRINGVTGYSWPSGVGAASYVGRLALVLVFLREGGGVERVSFELAMLDATASSSVVSEELGSGGCEKILAGGTMTEESAVVDETGIRTGWYNDCRPEDELASGTGTPYRERGSLWVGFATTPPGGPASAACALTGVIRGGSGCDGEDTE